MDNKIANINGNIEALEKIGIKMKQVTKVYIAGRISGYDNFKKHFARVERELTRLGYIVLNPSILPKGLTQEEYMRICIPTLNVCEAIYMLDGWETSVGASIEHSLAKQANKIVWYEIKKEESLNG